MHRAEKLAIFMFRSPRNPESLNLLKPSGPVEACTGIALPLSVQSLSSEENLDFLGYYVILTGTELRTFRKSVLFHLQVPAIQEN
jgi:hypothetical protein